MQKEDRKLACASVVVFVVIAAELAWFLFVGPINYNAHSSAGLPWWRSAAVWTAIFTLALTISTFLLWWQTRRLAEGAKLQSGQLERSITATQKAADAASKQAAASLGVELPRLIVTRVSIYGIEEDPRAALADFGPSVVFENHGRTAAVVVADCIEVMVASELPSEPVYSRGNIRRAALATVIEPEKDYSVSFSGRRRVTLSDTDINDVILGDKNLWVFGFVRYRDFLSESHMLDRTSIVWDLHGVSVTRP